MARLKNTDIQKTEKGKQYYTSNLYPDIDRNIYDIYVITTAGDRLDLLSYKYYGDSSYWWIIAHANNIANGSLAVTPGIQLRIPYDKNEYISIVEQSQKII